MDSFIFYRSFFEATECLSPNDQRKVLVAICNYALNGEVSQLSGAALAVFTVIKPNIDANNERRHNGGKGGRPSKKPMVIETETNGYEKTKPMVFKNDENKKPNVNVNVNVNDNEDVNRKEEVKEEKRRWRFTPPDVTEVAAYCAERGNGIDANQFVDFYASKGWKVGTNPMKDWKAAVRTWERRENRSPGQVKRLPGDGAGNELLRLIEEGAFDDDE